MSAPEPVEDTPALVPLCSRHIDDDRNTTNQRAPGVLISKPSDMTSSSKSAPSTLASLGATAYLGLEIGYRSITWIGKYKSKRKNKGKENGQEEGPIDPSMINYNLHEDEASAFRACIANYDNSEIRRVEAYNREYLLTLARRRVAHFSENGTWEPLVIRSEDYLTKVEPLVLASVALNEVNTFTSALAVGGLPIGRIEDDF